MSGLACCGHEIQWHHETRGCGYHGFAADHRCPCLLTSNEALTEAIHQAEARGAAAVVPLFRVAAELVVQDVRAQRGDHIASLVEDSFAVHFDRAAALTQDEQP